MILQMLRFLLGSLAASPLMLSAPIVMLLASVLTDYAVLLHAFDASTLLFFTALPTQVEDPRRIGAEEIKKTVQAGIYLFALVMCLLNWRAVYAYLKKWPHLVLLVGYLMFTATYSTDPNKVVTNSILILISILMPIAFAIGQKNSQNRLGNFYLVVLTPFIASHVASLFLLFYYSADPIELIVSTNRFGGFSGNPNSLGNSAVLGVWAAAALLASPHIKPLRRALALISLPIFATSVALSGSGTATVASITVVLIMIWMRLLASFKPSVRLIVNFFSAALLACLVLAVLLLVTPAEVFLAFTGSLGKDATLTGRTELWAIAKEAILQRPWFGWSFDSHFSVKAERAFAVRYNHYHNGFLDTVVLGGLLLLAIVLYNFGRFTQAFIIAFRESHAVFPLLVPFVMIIVLNMSEYSLLRPLSEEWQLYIACFVMLTYTHKGYVPFQKKIGSTRTKRRRKKALRWA